MARHFKTIEMHQRTVNLSLCTPQWPLPTSGRRSCIDKQWVALGLDEMGFGMCALSAPANKLLACQRLLLVIPVHFIQLPTSTREAPTTATRKKPPYHHTIISQMPTTVDQMCFTTSLLSGEHCEFRRTSGTTCGHRYTNRKGPTLHHPIRWPLGTQGKLRPCALCTTEQRLCSKERTHSDPDIHLHHIGCHHHSCSDGGVKRPSGLAKNCNMQGKNPCVWATT